MENNFTIGQEEMQATLALEIQERLTLNSDEDEQGNDNVNDEDSSGDDDNDDIDQHGKFY